MMKKYQFLTLLALMLMFVGNDARAQSFKLNNATLTKQYLMIDKEKVEVRYNGFATVAVAANCDYQATADDWMVVRRMHNGNTAIFPQPNFSSQAREGTVTFKSADGTVTRTLKVVQGYDTSYEELVTEEQIKVAGVSASEAQSGTPASNLTDGNFSTIWHSRWSGLTSFPVTLTFNFSNSPTIDYFVYTPRQDGSTNGNPKVIEVQTRCGSESTFTKYGEFNFGGSTAPSTVTFEGGLQNVRAIKIIIKSGQADLASGAEVQFFKKITDDPSTAIFADDSWTSLKAGTTQADINAIENSFCRSLAQGLFDGTYDKQYRVTQHACKYSPQALSDMWNAPGKYYDQLEGVTGINVKSGTSLNVAVSGIPSGKNATLKVVAWYVGKDGSNFDGGNPNIVQYALRNGLNRFEYTFEWDGLAYVTYFDDENPDGNSPITVHVINGEQNGYLSPDKTNNEMYELCSKAKNICMDLVGSKVHSVWTAAGLKNYCKTSTGSARGYRQYMNLLDTLVQWEHDVLGFTKYNRVPKNHTFAYTNWTYYMFQGSLGVSFHHGQESRVLNCQRVMFNDYDAVWGLSHEWGHQHQMAPYFNWAGMTEVTNNMNSYYNVVHMGYNKDYGHGAEPADGLVIYNGKVTGILSDKDQTTYTTLTQDGGPMTTRKNAYNSRSSYSWNSKLSSLCASMQNDSWTDKEKDGPLWFDYTNYATVRPYVALYQYAVDKLGLKDFAPDLYEALRQTDDEEGSKIEKTDGVDKYELLASAQNNNKNGKLSVFRSRYSSSTWTKNNYITTSHCGRSENSVPFIMNYIRKASRLTGYNLFPYFEKCGMLRQVALKIYDGNWYLMTADMYDEFKADMESLGLKTCDDAMVKAILTVATPTYSRPEIPN